ncbi:MAG: hypothetical protein V4857_00770 [Pseudomonadota bacterium]
MRRRLGQALRVGVGDSSLTLLKTSRWFGPAQTLMAGLPLARGNSPSAVAEALRQLLHGGTYAGWPVTLVLDEALVRLWHVTPPPGSARRADLEAAAALRFELLYGEPSADWKLSAAWDARRPFLAAAIARPMLAAFEQVAREERLALVEVVPQFVAGWNRWHGALRDDAWFALLQEQVLTLGAPRDGALASVRSVLLPEGAAPGWLAAHLAREALLLDLPAPARLQVCAGALGPLKRCADGVDCTLLGPEAEAGSSAGARLAATGSRA